jgi:hypothetical protein
MTDLVHRATDPPLIGRTLKFSVIWIPVVSTIVYVVGGVLAASDIARDDCRLPRLSWAENSSKEGCESETSSVFVIIAQESGLKNLATVFNLFLVFTALTCAETNLYIASRSLFGLTSRLDKVGKDTGGSSGWRQTLARWVLNAFAWVGRTNSFGIPKRAVFVSAGAFIWVPFLQLIHVSPGSTNTAGENNAQQEGDTSTPIGMVRYGGPALMRAPKLTCVGSVHRDLGSNGICRSHHCMALRMSGILSILLLVSYDTLTVTAINCLPRQYQTTPAHSRKHGFLTGLPLGRSGEKLSVSQSRAAWPVRVCHGWVSFHPYGR